ncbi:exonuclease SbcC [Syntrophus gentianae]|uniref:Exonuclease SbcC n=1 Tax=Syntrophus gentianae TaxID=43775 RepID=A0A1H8BCP7_9BACT|nr:AAA family ATPase [Syntrophus gentianae]SEM80526.1 exonuclease SbcC [Syntrophus gentianae]
MRILSVRFKNLNSLAGEWEVDFTHPAYTSDGIFAITGPTGAGKTTIMDAVCLALYGSTPRLDKVTKGGNEIMSRQTGECSAEVIFETGKGRYRCRWYQRRARKKPDGELQQSQHEISDADSGAILESKITRVGDFIEEVTGMDFGRFTQSMLLAQGDFAAFLKAPPNERSDILEQITGTEIYSQISMRVHERRAAEQDKLDLLQAELKGIRILGKTEEQELHDRLMEKQGLEAGLTRKLKETLGALAWVEGIAALEKELGELEKKKEAFEERRQGFAPEAMKLEKARKALGLEGDYRFVTVLRDVLVKETRELQDILAALPEREKLSTAALAARSTAEGLLREARERQASEGEIIKKVRDLDVRLNEQGKQLAEKNKAITGIEDQEKTTRGNVESNEQAMKKVYSALEELREYQTMHAVDALLVARFGVIEQEFEWLDTAKGKYEKTMEKLSQAAKKKESALATVAGKEADHDKALLEFEKKQTMLRDLSDEITTLLQGRDIGQMREDLDVAKERERLLVQAGETVTRMDQASTALGDLKTNLGQMVDQQATILSEIQSLSAQKILQEKEIAALETQVLLLSRIRDLEEERKRLVDGQACPLCGATEHPYATGNLPALDEAELDLQERKNLFKELTQRLTDLGTKEVKTATDIQHTEKEIAEKKTALDLDEEHCVDILSKLNLEALPVERSERIRVERYTVQVKIVEKARIVSSVEEKAKQEKSAQADLEEARETVDNTGKGLLDAQHTLEIAVLDQERLKEECAGLVTELEKNRATVLEDIRPLGISEIPADGFNDLLKELTRRKTSWQEKEAEKTALEKKAGDIKAGLETHWVLLGKLEDDLALRRKNRDSLKEEHEALLASRLQLFGNKKADEEEKRIVAAVDQANAKLEKAREDCDVVEKEINVLKEKIDSLSERISRRTEELIQMEQQVRRRIQSAGFIDEADYLACRLSEDERELLAAKEQSLLKEKFELDARLKDKTDALINERQKELTDISAEELASKVEAVNAELKQQGLDIGGLRQVLADNEQQRSNQQERLKAIDLQKKEWFRWDDLHDLIGSADGKKFRNYAQGLTFEMMTSHANRRLREMTDRYLLIRDEKNTLELNVIDNYQAGEIRSTKNLSGGESFIVSLSLALGLSQMASRNVRVDSLFLDEGFGTLDEDSLETALETLAGLRQDGKLIGVISHVAALKERIGTQIQVIPQSGGRSTLIGPGCRKIESRL